MVNFYSTGEVAGKLGITRVTLQDWIKKGKIRPPKLVRVGRIKVRLWTAQDVRQLQALRKTIYHQKPVARAK
jgi:excisionase family DNA binding protein